MKSFALERSTVINATAITSVYGWNMVTVHRNCVAIEGSVARKLLASAIGPWASHLPDGRFKMILSACSLLDHPIYVILERHRLIS